MVKIKRLSQTEAQKIAAGEVVQRPSNILKELIENSLDAKATSIDIEILDGGKRSIKIIDNGCGMSNQDVLLSVENHSTSKITNIEDLNKLGTFGFRGEALASIKAVSNLTIITKEKNESVGIKVKFNDLNYDIEKVACNTGTTILVENIFYNVPVRQKFLKTTQTELRSIVELFHAFCLDYHEVSFRLYHQNKLIYNCLTTNSIIKRVSQLYNTNLSEKLLSVDNSDYLSKKDNKENNIISLSGAISNTDYYRYDRGQIFLFVNNRWVKNYKIVQAVIKGYSNILQPKTYPAAFLFITLDNKYIDVNIHPRKEEVQFLYPRLVEKFIQNSVNDTLNKFHSDQFNINTKEEYNNIKTTFKVNLSNSLLEDKNINYHDIKNDNKNDIQEKKTQDKIFLNTLNTYFKSNKNDSNTKPEVNIDKGNYSNNINLDNKQNIENTNNTNKNIFIDTQKSIEDKLEYKLIGQILKTYIIIENSRNLILIDQHAAHERIIYEKLKKSFKFIEPIKLVFPKSIILNKQDLNILLSIAKLLEQSGIIIKQMSDEQVMITHSPIILKNKPIDDLIKQIISLYNKIYKIDKDNINKIIQEQIHSKISCTSAVKAGDILGDISMNNIICTLYNTDNKLTCPHGRPTMWTIYSSEIEKKFKRDYR